jgi:hypothetical protein
MSSTPTPAKSASSERPSVKTHRPIGLVLAFGIPLNTFVLTTAAATLLHHHERASYYPTVAFLIPSLLVTLALQGQFFRMEYAAAPPQPLVDRHPHVARALTRLERIAAVAMLAYLAAGEFASLYVLAAQKSTALLFGVTAGAVVTAFLALGVIALIGTPWKN